MSYVSRCVALFCLFMSLSFALAALTSTAWVQDNNVKTYSQQVDFGVTHWRARWQTSAGSTDTGLQSFSSSLYDELGLSVYLDRQSQWKSAGMAALALGALGVAFNGIAALTTLTSFIRPMATYLSIFPAFLSGFCFILGAVLYEGLRPSFHGDEGYNWAFGLYLTSGVVSSVAAYSLYWGSGSDKHDSLPASLSQPLPTAMSKV